MVFYKTKPLVDQSERTAGRMDGMVAQAPS